MQSIWQNTTNQLPGLQHRAVALSTNIWTLYCQTDLSFNITMANEHYGMSWDGYKSFTKHAYCQRDLTIYLPTYHLSIQARAWHMNLEPKTLTHQYSLSPTGRAYVSTRTRLPPKVKVYVLYTSLTMLPSPSSVPSIRQSVTAGIIPTNQFTRRVGQRGYPGRRRRWRRTRRWALGCRPADHGTPGKLETKQRNHIHTLLFARGEE